MRTLTESLSQVVLFVWKSTDTHAKDHTGIWLPKVFTVITDH